MKVGIYRKRHSVVAVTASRPIQLRAGDVLVLGWVRDERVLPLLESSLVLDPYEIEGDKFKALYDPEQEEERP